MLGLSIDRKIDPIAVTALILSLIAAITGLIAAVRGPSIRFITPEKVILYSDITPDGQAIVRVGAPMAYANVAQGPYGTLIVRESVTMAIGGTLYEQQWNAFGEVNREGVEQTSVVMPQSLPGQSAVSHVTLFTPLPGQPKISPEQFQKAIATTRQLTFEFRITPIKGSELSKLCDVALTDTNRKQIADAVSQRMAVIVCHRHSRDF